MKLDPIFAIARLELTINIRNKWTLIFAVVFCILVVSISYFGLLAEGFAGMQNFLRTSASILNLILYIVPLVALTMGTLSFTGEKSNTELLFSQPVSRIEIYLGKFIGLIMSITVSTLLGFTIAGGIIGYASGFNGMWKYISLVLLSLMLALVFLSIAILVATINHRKSKAFGVSLFLWFFFVLFYDLLTIGGTLILKGQYANYFLFLSLFGNPVSMIRVASLIILDNVTIFGAAGAALLRFFGGSTLSVGLLISALVIWIVFPLTLSARLLRRQDI